MAFSEPLIELIYHEIKLRQNDLGRLSLVEFEDEEYGILRRVGQMIIREYESGSQSKQKEARTVFLAFACEYVRRYKYINDNKFWNDFEHELDLGSRWNPWLIREVLWQAFEEEGIEQRRRSDMDRLIIESLVSEVHSSDAARTELLTFFCWYYQNHTDIVVTPQLIQKYNETEKKSLHIPEKAISRLNEDCQTLTKIIQYATEHNLYLAHSEINIYRQEVTKALGALYDPTHLHLIRSRIQLHNLIRKLENYCTPTQFLHILESDPRATIHTPKGDAYAVYKIFPYWQTKEFPYGSYKINDVEYRVVPLPWLWLETIAQWPYEEVVSLRRKDYLAYKKQQPFEVHVGKRVIKGRLCIPHSGERYYIWVDALPRGERLVIDGRLYPASEGIDWAVSLRLHIDEDGKLIIAIVFDWLKAFFPEQIGRRILICTSQDHEWIGYVRLNGTCQRSHAIVFPLNEFAEPITISVYLDEKFLDSKVLSPNLAYLFSCQTHESIPADTKREWGEYQYYLFTTLDKNIQVGEGIEIERLDTDFGSYGIYQVRWKDNGHPFSLYAGGISWNFQRQSYFLIQVKPPHADGMVQLAIHHIYCFSQATIEVLTNKDPIHTSMMYQVFFADELIVEEETSKCLQHLSGDNRYRITVDFLSELDSKVLKHCGQYNILFSEEGRILDQTTVALIPEIEVALSDSDQPLLEGETLPLRVSSPYLPVWDPTSGQVASSANISVRPNLLSQPWKLEDNFPEGLMYLTSQMITLPIIFPTIGEVVDINICPKVFGYRLYQQRHNATTGNQKDIPHRQTDELDYYALETAVLYIFTKAKCNVAVCVDKTVILSGHADAEGNVFIRELGRLKRYCRKEQTTFSIISAGLESTFCTRWTPFIHNMIVKEGRVCLDVSGPQGTGVSLQIIDLSNKIREQRWVACKGERFSTSVDLPSIRSDWGQCYLVPIYHLSDGTQLPSTWQWRINLSQFNALSATWLQTGIGISSEELLQTLLWSSK